MRLAVMSMPPHSTSKVRCLVAAVVILLIFTGRGVVSNGHLDMPQDLNESSPPKSSSFLSIDILGDPIPVWSALDTWKKCHLIDVPDTPARAFVHSRGATAEKTSNASSTDAEEANIRMVCGAVGYHEMHGPSIFNQTRSCQIAWNASKDPDPSMFAGNEFIDAPFLLDENNGTVVALVHTEYPGNVYKACDISSAATEERRTRQQHLTYPTCWTVTIGLAISHDFGHTWQHIAEPPNHLVAAVPYTYHQEYMAYGWGDPSNIMKHPTDGYYYATMWNRHQVGEQPPGVCVMRTNNLLDPKSWRGWNGTDFVVQFVDPYRQGADFRPADHVCRTVTIADMSNEECNIFGLSWSVDMKRFVATIGCFHNDSFFLSTSLDLTEWSPAQELYNRARDLPQHVAAVTTGFSYPAFLDPAAFTEYGDANFYTIGQEPYLFWTSMGHSPYKDGRHLWATPMRIRDERNVQFETKV